jgi:DNA-binding transcriptional ArsR family regulator
MSSEPNLATVAGAVIEPARASILQHLLDGRSWTATELAKVANVGASTASVHLRRLLECELIKVTPTGRHRYYRLAGDQVAKLVEQLQCFAPPQPAATPGQRRSSAALHKCRLCYDHIAGRIGVALAEAMLRKSWLVEQEPWFNLTESGAEALSPHGIEPVIGRTCMDWSERRFHVAGSLGIQLAHFCLQNKVLVRDGKSRALRVPPSGHEALKTIFGVTVEPFDR